MNSLPDRYAVLPGDEYVNDFPGPSFYQLRKRLTPEDVMENATPESEVFVGIATLGLQMAVRRLCPSLVAVGTPRVVTAALE